MSGLAMFIGLVVVLAVWLAAIPTFSILETRRRDVAVWSVYLTVAALTAAWAIPWLWALTMS